MNIWSEKLHKTFGLKSCPYDLFYEFKFARTWNLATKMA